MFHKGTVSLNTSARNSFSKQPQKKVISFVGDMEKNIKEIIENLHCKCANSCFEFHQILLIFSDKINKLRTQRDVIKQKYYSQVEEFKYQIYQLQQKIEKLEKQLTKYRYIDENQLKAHTYDSFNELLKGNSPNDSTEFDTNLLSEMKPEFKPQNLDNMINKYNITMTQLEHIISEYVEEQDSYFDTEQDKKLYKLGKKLEKQLWKKKVKKDVEAIMNARTGSF